MSKVSSFDLMDLKILSSEVLLLKAVRLMHPHSCVIIIHSCSVFPSNNMQSRVPLITDDITKIVDGYRSSNMIFPDVDTLNSSVSTVRVVEIHGVCGGEHCIAKMIVILCKIVRN